MIPPELSQLRFDFRRADGLVEEYIPETEREDALRMVRQVNGVTTYLSWMSTGEVRMEEAYRYAVAIAGMDVLTDAFHEPLSDGAVRAALGGDPGWRCLEPVHMAKEAARDKSFPLSMEKIAEWQDKSLEQFREPSDEMVLKITRRKGGFSALAHLQAIKESPSDREQNFMFEFGETMQLLDDYMDAPSDEDAGISTAFTEHILTPDDLSWRIRHVEQKCADLWGREKPARRFGKVMRLHKRLGDLENKRPGTVRKVLPWYF